MKIKREMGKEILRQRVGGGERERCGEICR